ncbi:MAG: calcium/sodium antiporter [Rhodomicrobium sp.]|nr:calcium/sodium antiporter [Rhodomicrobium sp.]
MIYFEIIAGILLLLAGGELLVRGAVQTARHLGVSPLLIGLTFVSFGTSAPELVTSVEAALLESPGIAVGNVVGSNIANVLLILGLTALLQPVETPENGFRRDGIMLLLATFACLTIILMEQLSRAAGGIMLGLLAGYILYCYRTERVAPGPEQSGRAQLAPFVAVVLALLGLTIIIAGARFLVYGAIQLAELAGVSETIIGLTIVAVGTSLPELAASAVAALRGEPGVAFGNIIGSSIYNILGILGVTALIHPIAVPSEIMHFDIWVMTAATLAMIVFALTNRCVSRSEGGGFLAAYIVYIGFLAYST